MGFFPLMGVFPVEKQPFFVGLAGVDFAGVAGDELEADSGPSTLFRSRAIWHLMALAVRSLTKQFC